MTRLLLDSSAYIAFKKRHPAAAEILVHADEIAVNPIVLGELRADRYAIIRTALKKAGTPISTNDIWIAASAMQHGLPILTSDADFQKVPQVIVHHFSPA